MNIQQQEKFKVLLIGDSCEDVYLYGIVARISPETPVPVLKQIRTETKLGMASNVKHNLIALGCDVDVCTNCPEQITKTRYIDKKSGYHLLRLDKESDISPWSGESPEELSYYDAVIVSDYNKGFVTYDHYKHLQENYEGPIFVDTKKTDLAQMDQCVVKINSLEYSKIKTECSQLIVTQGKHGAMYKNIIYLAPEVEVFDVCGAGDTFLAALTYKYLLDRHIVQAINFANRAASITIMHRGNYAPTIEEIL